jgi:hypothetical protein
LAQWAAKAALDRDAAMLQIRDVTRRFGRNIAVDQVALEIPQGQMGKFPRSPAQRCAAGSATAR